MDARHFVVYIYMIINRNNAVIEYIVRQTHKSYPYRILFYDFKENRRNRAYYRNCLLSPFKYYTVTSSLLHYAYVRKLSILSVRLSVRLSCPRSVKWLNFCVQTLESKSKKNYRVSKQILEASYKKRKRNEVFYAGLNVFLIFLFLIC